MNTHTQLTSVQSRLQFRIDRSGAFTEFLACRHDLTLLTHTLYLDSPATVAACAIIGKITRQREFMTMETTL